MCINQVSEADTKLLVDVFREINIHPFVGLKLFVKNPPIDEATLDLRDIPFRGHRVKVYRMGSNSKVNIWRVSEDMASLITQTYHSLSASVRRLVHEKSDHFYHLEKSTKNDHAMQISRLLLGLYENQTVRVKATISDYYKIQLDHDTRVRVSFQNLTCPDTEAVYADHTHVLLREPQITSFTNLPIGTSVEFQATVHSYYHRNAEKKYGLHDLQNVRVC